jgi:hypothetical protein
MRVKRHIPGVADGVERPRQCVHRDDVDTRRIVMRRLRRTIVTLAAICLLVAATITIDVASAGGAAVAPGPEPRVETTTPSPTTTTTTTVAVAAPSPLAHGARIR